jgi:hypothetical protein
MDEDSGVLGNLPRSRPGTRSQKRDAPARAARSAEQRSAPAARPSAQARPRPKARPKPAPAPEPPSSDPVGGAVRTAAKVAGGGLKLANGLTREVLRRLPKP